MSVPVSGVKAIGAVEPVVVEHMSPVYVGGSAVSAVRSGNQVWVPLDDLHRMDRELTGVRGQLDTARVDATTAQDATRSAETRLRAADETVERMRIEDANRNEAARQWADENDLCGRFEDFCEAYGWEGRRKDYDVTVRVSFDVVVSVGDVRRGDDDSYTFRERIDNDFSSGELLELARDSGDTPSVEILNWDESE